MDKPLIIPLFLPHAGCPFTCVYCNQWQVSGQKREIKPTEIASYVQTYLKRTRAWPHRDKELAFYGGSFTALPLEKQQEFLKAAVLQKEKGFLQGIRLSTRPDCLQEEVVENLAAYGVTTVELGAQSLVDEVLEEAGRGHQVAHTLEATRLLRKYGIGVGYQLMLGLPGDNAARADLTGRRVVQARPDFIRIYPTLVLKGTVLEKWYQNGQYLPWSLAATVRLAAFWQGLFSYYQIPVIRMGLQAVTNLKKGKDWVAGPYHPAFGQLVESHLLLAQMEMGLAQLDKLGPELTLCFPAKLQSSLVGQKRENLVFLEREYGFKSINLKPETNLKKRDLLLTSAGREVWVKEQDFLQRYRIK